MIIDQAEGRDDVLVGCEISMSWIPSCPLPRYVRIESSALDAFRNYRCCVLGRGTPEVEVVIASAKREKHTFQLLLGKTLTWTR